MHESDDTDDGDSGEGISATVSDHPEVRPVADEQPPDPKADDMNEPVSQEFAPPPALGQISDGTSIMYIQTCFWVASYAKMRAERGDFSQDQIIEQFGVNVRKCINPEWKADA